MNILGDISTAIVIGDSAKTVESIQNALRQGISPDRIMNEALIPGMRLVGQKYEQKQYFIPEVLLSATAMKAGLSILKPLLRERNIKPLGVVVLGTVEGDLHEIGKNVVAVMMEGAGFEVINLGGDVSPMKFVETVKTTGAEIMGMSALLTTTRVMMARTIKQLTSVGIRNKVKVMVGGAAVSNDFAVEIGADSYAKDALQSVVKAKEILKPVSSI